MKDLQTDNKKRQIYNYPIYDYRLIHRRYTVHDKIHEDTIIE